MVRTKPGGEPGARSNATMGRVKPAINDPDNKLGSGADASGQTGRRSVHISYEAIAALTSGARHPGDDGMDPPCTSIYPAC